MNIPDEAYQAARTALWGRPAGDATLVAQMAVEAAAPHIVKAARLDELGRIISHFAGMHDELDEYLERRQRRLGAAVSDMNIPEESPWGPVPDTVRVEFVGPGESTPELTVGLLADIKQVQRERDAAVARTAQVAILREIADEWANDEIGTSGDTVERETWWAAIGELRATADELEQP